MDHDYRIRAASGEDLPHLPEIERAAASLFRDFGLADLFSSLLTPVADLERGLAESRLWVATTKEGTPVGFALACVVGGTAHLDELDVHPAHVRRGLGTALVEQVEGWARACGFSTVTLTTLRQVPWNAPFYERLGYRIMEPAELTCALRALLRSETGRGLPADGRVAMTKDLPG